MKITTIELPIYDLQLVVIIDSWEEANKKFKLNFSEDDYNCCAWTIHNEPGMSNSEVYLMLRDPFVDYGTIMHEMIHVISAICELRNIAFDTQNDEPIAYLNGYIGQKVFEFRDKHLTPQK